MPPRPRGRAGARGRGAGAGRGGATATFPIVHVAEPSETPTSLENAPPLAKAETDTEAEAKAPAQPMIPKAEDETDLATPGPAQHAPTTVESQASSSVAASAIPPSQDGLESQTRPPVQRLGSLQGSIPPSRSASPSVRGRGNTIRGGKRGTIRPTHTSRRSKEDRDALAKEQRDKDALRNAEREAAIRKKEHDDANKAKREARHALRGRGGYSGAMSGPFSMGSSREDRKNTTRSTTSGFGSGSGSRASRVKTEAGTVAGSSHRSGGPSSSVKKEEGDYISSDEEDDADVPRKDIDLIEISSDEHDDTTDAPPKPRPQRTALPVRISRREHQERTFGINTEVSTEISGKILEQAEATGQPLAAVATGQVVRKGKGKAKDTDATSTRKPFRGVWQDTEDSQNPIEIDSDEDMLDAEQVGLVEPSHQLGTKLGVSSSEVETAPQPRTKGIAEPVLQTDEDRAEWARFQSNLRHIRAELGPEELPATDGTDNVLKVDNSNKSTVRDNNVYLVQLPVLMPELLHANIKKEPSDPQGSEAMTAPAQPPKTEPKIKLEEGTFSDPSIQTQSGPRFASGAIGKLRVHQSGRTTLDWGGASFELEAGHKVSFLQEVVSVNVVPEKDRMVLDDAGTAVSLGRVKGKFIVVPDWLSMMG